MKLNNPNTSHPKSCFLSININACGESDKKTTTDYHIHVHVSLTDIYLSIIFLTYISSTHRTRFYSRYFCKQTTFILRRAYSSNVKHSLNCIKFPHPRSPTTHINVRADRGFKSVVVEFSTCEEILKTRR